jgi:23S rRNA (cytosine1962-C5)-methyltransferase
MNDPVANALPVLRLKRNEDKRLRAGHLWVFSNEVDTAATPLTSFTPGAAVRIVNHREAFVGYGCINPQALICARILSRNADIPVGHTLLVKRLRSALALLLVQLVQHIVQRVVARRAADLA